MASSWLDYYKNGLTYAILKEDHNDVVFFLQTDKTSLLYNRNEDASN